DISDLILSKSNTKDTNGSDKDEDFNYWLAGLIDGDGTLSVYKSNAQVCEITLGEEDVKTLYKIKQRFHMSLLKRSKVKAYRWRVSIKLYVIDVLNSINGKLLTYSKHVQLVKVCNKLNIEPIITNKISKNNS
ncbi:homing endonuclease, partial [Zychaea mexicana]|uniref:homing endonuclease n=1 Tax=Zychaea mexicana TaxID=64656 RepID=UPI0022FF2BEA